MCQGSSSPQSGRVRDSDLCQTELRSMKKLSTSIPVGYRRKPAGVKAGPQMFPPYFGREESPNAMAGCKVPKRASRHREELAKQSLVTYWLDAMQATRTAPRLNNGL